MGAYSRRINTALLRAPPFPGVNAAVSRSEAVEASVLPTSDEIDRLFAAIRDGQVGGCFWGTLAPETKGGVIIRTKAAHEAGVLRASLSEADQAGAICLSPADDIDPWSLLKPGVRLFAHGDDEWAALGHINGGSTHFLSAGRFGAPGASDAEVRKFIGTELFGRRYRDPFTGEKSNAASVVALLAEWRRMFEANRPIVAACGIAWWKRREIARFLWAPQRPLRFFWSERRAIARSASAGGSVAVWPSRISALMVEKARANSVPVVRVEDGFVRSVGLGSNLVPPSSIAVDRLGIHYDPTRPSDLEEILAHAEFPPSLLARAKRLRGVILAASISKYGGDEDHIFPARTPHRRLVLVPGQVEDDMSVLLGGGGLSSNLELLRRARALEPDAEIWFRPHPDVDAGHRKGTIVDTDALAHADRVVRGGGMAKLLDHVDAVHVLTSLTGFEALLRLKDVTCHGTPFYAGWGLTRDLGRIPGRRGRGLSLAELIAGVLILYPRYLDPVTGLPCPPEVLIRRMTDGTARNRLAWISRLRRLQGRLIGSR